MNIPDELAKIAEKIHGLDDPGKINALLADYVRMATEFCARERKKLKYFSPTKQRIKRLQLIDIENKVEQIKQRLHFHEEQYEAEKQQNAELDRLLDEGMEASAKIYVEFKYNLPDKLEEFEKTVLEPLTPDLREEFFALVARFEAERKEKE